MYISEIVRRLLNKLSMHIQEMSKNGRFWTKNAYFAIFGWFWLQNHGFTHLSQIFHCLVAHISIIGTSVRRSSGRRSGGRLLAMT